MLDLFLFVTCLFGVPGPVEVCSSFLLTSVCNWIKEEMLAPLS